MHILYVDVVVIFFCFVFKFWFYIFYLVVRFCGGIQKDIGYISFWWWVNCSIISKLLENKSE